MSKIINLTTNLEESDLEDISNFELVIEICTRMQNITKNKELKILTTQQQQDIYEDFLPLAREFQIALGILVFPDTLYDVQKMEYFSKIFDQYSLDELISLLPNKGFKK